MKITERLISSFISILFVLFKVLIGIVSIAMFLTAFIIFVFSLVRYRIVNCMKRFSKFTKKNEIGKEASHGSPIITEMKNGKFIFVPVPDPQAVENICAEIDIVEILQETSKSDRRYSFHERYH
jgi:hypothetical protein